MPEENINWANTNLAQVFMNEVEVEAGDQAKCEGYFERLKRFITDPGEASFPIHKDEPASDDSSKLDHSWRNQARDWVLALANVDVKEIINRDNGREVFPTNITGVVAVYWRDKEKRQFWALERPGVKADRF